MSCQDYWGTITQIDAAVGRVRQLLATHGVCWSPTGYVGHPRGMLVTQGVCRSPMGYAGHPHVPKVADSTWVSITADNGPEVDPAGGQGTGSFPNPVERDTNLF